MVLKYIFHARFVIYIYCEIVADDIPNKSIISYEKINVNRDLIFFEVDECL